MVSACCLYADGEGDAPTSIPPLVESSCVGGSSPSLPHKDRPHYILFETLKSDSALTEAGAAETTTRPEATRREKAVARENFMLREAEVVKGEGDVLRWCVRRQFGCW